MEPVRQSSEGPGHGTPRPPRPGEGTAHDAAGARACGRGPGRGCRSGNAVKALATAPPPPPTK